MGEGRPEGRETDFQAISEKAALEPEPFSRKRVGGGVWQRAVCLLVTPTPSQCTSPMSGRCLGADLHNPRTGPGLFGWYHEGLAQGLEEVGRGAHAVALKTVNELAIANALSSSKEASVMKAFKCHHVVKEGQVKSGSKLG